MPSIIAPLGNYLCSEPRITIDPNTSIEELPPHIESVVAQAAEQKMIRHLVSYHYCLVYRNYDPDHQDSRQIMERLIVAMRLFKPGNVFYNYAIVDDQGFYESPHRAGPVELGQFAVFFFFGWHCEGLIDQYEPMASEIAAFSRFVSDHWAKGAIYSRPFRFFFKAYHEAYAEHRFLDYAIALENVLVNDSKDMSNIRYKFVDRGCYLLSKYYPALGQPDEHSRVLQRIYDRRCEIVHSTPKDRDWNEQESVEILQKADSYTRAILTLLLSDEALSDSKQIDRQKRALYA